MAMNSPTSNIHVGTSGYSFTDWQGTVYPTQLRKGQFLSHYARMFDAVEINTTYYRIPSPTMFVHMLEKVPADFSFIVKLPRQMTHERQRFRKAIDPFLGSLRPLIEAGQLRGMLAQFPFSFKNGEASREHLRLLADALNSGGTPVNVEFRHDSWYEESTYDLLRELGLGFVNVDLPQLRHLPKPSNVTTNGTAYCRLHGRNARQWWQHPTPSHRYDYLYSDHQLERWATALQGMAHHADQTFVFANNCHLGQSVVNAFQLHQRLGLSTPTLPPGQEPDLFPKTALQRATEIETRIVEARNGKA